jgi:hypothetical protein
MEGNSMRKNRETPLVSGSNTPDRLAKATSYTASRNASGESDEQGVPAKRPTKGEQSSVEGMEGSFRALQTFRREVARACLEALRRRSQRHRLP